MSIGIEDHRVPPKFLLEKTLEQVKQLANQKPEDSPLALPLKSFPASISAAQQERIKAEMLAAIGKQVLPAYMRFARFLEVSYIPAGRDEPGISALPDGAKYYQLPHSRKPPPPTSPPTRFTRSALTKSRKMKLTCSSSRRNSASPTCRAFRASLKVNPKLKPASAAALLDAYRGYLGPMQARLPQLFGHLPKAKFEVVPVPDYIEKSSAGAYYQAGTTDGTRPGRLFINTYNATDRNLDEVEATAYHEGIPGHHLQISIAQEMQKVPEFRKYENFTAYDEGWALYSERLGKDVGLYQDPYSDYGRLEEDILRAIRLVVDTGVHSQHWTRQQMVDFFHQHSAIEETEVQIGGRSLHRMAQPGPRLQDRTAQDPRVARKSEKGTRRQVRYPRLSRPGHRLRIPPARRPRRKNHRLDRRPEIRNPLVASPQCCH